MQGSCLRLAMAKIDIGGQVHMAAHGYKWPCSIYNLETLQYYTNSNLFLEFLYLLRFSRLLYGNFARSEGGTLIIKKQKNKTDPKNEKFWKFAETRPKKI